MRKILYFNLILYSFYFKMYGNFDLLNIYHIYMKINQIIFICLNKWKIYSKIEIQYNTLSTT
jgi:hypothetical protein